MVLKNTMSTWFILAGLDSSMFTLDLMILRLFSNLDDSMVCSFIQRIHYVTVYDFKTQKLMLYSQREKHLEKLMFFYHNFH